MCSAENELVDDDDRVDDDQGYCLVNGGLAGSGIGMRVRVFVEAGISLEIFAWKNCCEVLGAGLEMRGLLGSVARTPHHCPHTGDQVD